MKWLFLSLAWLCVALGFLGVFLPVLPTTPFLLLALYLFSRSSPRWRIALMRHPLLGPYVRGYASKEGLSVRAKAVTLVILWVTIAVSVVWVADVWWSRLILVAVAVGITIHILLKKTRRPESTPATDPSENQNFQDK